MMTVKRKEVVTCLSCSICCGILNEATTLSVCLHTFCKSCIRKKIVEEDISNCPQCEAYLGGAPLEKLRVDNILQKIRETIFPTESCKRKFCELLKLTHQNIQKTDTIPRSDVKKVKHSRVSMAFIESATVKELHQHHTSRSKNVQEIGPPDQQNPFDVLETGSLNVSELSAECQTYWIEPKPIWFSLISSTERNGLPPLPQIPLRYVNTKNGNAPVHLIKKYLVRKLKLSSETEVEITLVSQVIGDHCRLKDLLELWLRKRPQAKRIGEDSVKDSTMPLVYARKARFD